MEKAIIDFIGRLRQAGLNISPAETLDASGTMSCIDLADRGLVKDALRSVLVKNRGQIEVFDALFDLFFQTGSGWRSGIEETEAERPRDMSAVLAGHIQAQSPDLSVAAELTLTGQFGALTKMLINTGQGVGLNRMSNPLQAGYYTRRMRQALNLERIKAEADRFLQELDELGLPPDQGRALESYIAHNLDRLEAEMTVLIRRELQQQKFQFIRHWREEGLTERRLAGLTESELLAMRPHVERLARRIKERLSLRLKKGHQGRLDLKTTLRRNIGLGGPLASVFFQTRKPARPQVVALCDVSNSVKNFSRFMLLFLYTLKEVVYKVRSFIFIGDLTEVTDIFRQKDLSEAVGLAAAGQGLTYTYRTDYGSSFKQFVGEYLNAVNGRTTVFVLGDARNNYFAPQEEALARIAGRARRLIWLNPEPVGNWRLGDSVMKTYMPYCTTVAECGNLSQLSSIIEGSLVP